MECRKLLLFSGGRLSVTGVEGRQLISGENRNLYYKYGNILHGTPLN